MAADAVFESIIAQRDGESLLGDQGEAEGFFRCAAPQQHCPGKRLKAGINTGANGVTALLGERDRQKHWTQTHPASQLLSGDQIDSWAFLGMFFSPLNT